MKFEIETSLITKKLYCLVKNWTKKLVWFGFFKS